jgi:hypothetical protein
MSIFKFLLNASRIDNRRALRYAALHFVDDFMQPWPASCRREPRRAQGAGEHNAAEHGESESDKRDEP